MTPWTSMTLSTPRLRTFALSLVWCVAACAAAGTNDSAVSSSEGSGDSGDTTAQTEGSQTTMSSSSTTSTMTSTSTTTSSGPLDTGSDESDTAATTGGPIEPGPDFRLRGPHEVQTEPGQLQIGGGCTMAYDTFAPIDVADAPTVVLAHGFQGNRGSMAGWADHWASWGVRVVTPNLCHATIIDADHAQNGADLVTLIDHLDVGAVALAGYSAGGLAAVIAAAAQPDTLALVGLDMVDSGGLGALAAPDVSAPAHDIVAEPAMCNSTSNGVPVFAAIETGLTVRLLDADHCDFQNPGDNFCGLCAAANESNTPEAIQAAIFGLSTAALMWRLDLDASGAQWWTAGGPYYDEMFVSGVLAQL